MTNLEYKNGSPIYEPTETSTKIKNIFNEQDEAMIAHLLKKCMGMTDEDSLPDGMVETPHRMAKYWTECFASGYMTDPKDYLKKTFDVERASDKELGDFTHGIVVSKFKLFSQCEHHVAPFGTYKDNSWVYVAYIPGAKVVGLSKIPRMARGYAKRFQIQEQLGEQIADAMMEVLQPLGVYVYMKDLTHSCVVTRGVKSEDGTTSTSVLRGCFCTDKEAREEALNLMR